MHRSKLQATDEELDSKRGKAHEARENLSSYKCDPACFDVLPCWDTCLYKYYHHHYTISPRAQLLHYFRRQIYHVESLRCCMALVSWLQPNLSCWRQMGPLTCRTALSRPESRTSCMRTLKGTLLYCLAQQDMHAIVL